MSEIGSIHVFPFPVPEGWEGLGVNYIPTFLVCFISFILSTACFLIDYYIIGYLVTFYLFGPSSLAAFILIIGFGGHNLTFDKNKHKITHYSIWLFCFKQVKSTHCWKTFRGVSFRSTSTIDSEGDNKIVNEFVLHTTNNEIILKEGIEIRASLYEPFVKSINEYWKSQSGELVSVIDSFGRSKKNVPKKMACVNCKTELFIIPGALAITCPQCGAVSRIEFPIAIVAEDNPKETVSSDIYHPSAPESLEIGEESTGTS